MTNVTCDVILGPAQELFIEQFELKHICIPNIWSVIDDAIKKVQNKNKTNYKTFYKQPN